MRCSSLWSLQSTIVFFYTTKSNRRNYHVLETLNRQSVLFYLSATRMSAIVITVSSRRDVGVQVKLKDP